jgi:peptidoglycan L-alanyl-D-glutamate endopeptidase CwlK
MFKLSQRSEDRLTGVHPDLVRVVRRALELSEVDFSVIEGVRSVETQRKYVESGASKTMNSRHITGHAVDLYPVGKPTPWELCPKIADAMFKASRELKIPIRWGGDWNQNGSSADERFYDGPHFELLRSRYP